MANHPGYSLSPTAYARFLELSRNEKRNGPPQRIRQRRRQPIFQPGAGSKVYQCVTGNRLRAGTVAAEDDTSKYEPVCVCVPLGSAADESLDQFDNATVYQLSQAVVQLGIATKGVVDQSAFDDNSTANEITDLTGGNGLTMLRTRFCSGYPGTGIIITGNDSEAWYAGSGDVFEAKLKAEWIDGTKKVLAKITMNQGAVDAGIVDSSGEIFDYIAIQTPNDEAVFMAKDDVVLVEFNQQVFFADDDAYVDRFWRNDDNQGFVPIFNLVNTSPTQTVTGDPETIIPAYGCIRVTTGTWTDGKTAVKRPSTYGAQYSHFFNGPNSIKVGETGWAQAGAGPWIAAYDSADGQPANGELWGPRTGTYLLKKNTGGFIVRGVVDSKNSLVLVDRCPFLRFHGTTVAAITKDNTGDVNIFYGTGAGTDSTVDMVAVRNNFADVAISKDVECVWEGDLAGIKWILVAAEC